MHYVFTERSLEECLTHAGDDWFLEPNVPEDFSWNVIEVYREDIDTKFILHHSDSDLSPQIILVNNDDSLFEEVCNGSVLKTAVQRLLRAFKTVQNGSVHLDRSWSEYNVAPLFSFYATGFEKGKLRWIAENLKGSDRNFTAIAALMLSETYVTLEDFEPDHTLTDNILSVWDAAINSGKSIWAKATIRQTENLSDVYDLDRLDTDSVTKSYTYDDWLNVLTEGQRNFVDKEIAHSVKLRGTAGTGKTISLSVKLLHELYSARKKGTRLRILFASHSWAMADKVMATLQAINKDCNLSEVDVVPLLEVLLQFVPNSQIKHPPSDVSSGYRLLGDDNLSGKRLILEKISNIVEDVKNGDWLTFKSGTSECFAKRVEAPKESAEKNSFVWDLINEFSSVISANGIMPGMNAQRKYFEIQRASWMMLLQTDREKSFVLHIYSKYISSLEEDKYISSDQIISDCLNFLTTFNWYRRRKEDGYDFIFVDEFHLFSEQERFTLNYLSRDPDQYPKIVMALDPLQSPSDVYAGFSDKQIKTKDSGEAEHELGSVDEYTFTKVHRFSPEILNLVKHIHNTYPGLELGDDWKIASDLESLKDSSGVKPCLRLHQSLDTEFDSVIREVEQLIRVNANKRVAIVLLDVMLIDEFERSIQHKFNYVVVKGKDDFDNLRYARKSVVLSASEYVAGLQFDTVICAGFTLLTGEGINSEAAPQFRSFLSLLYLAVSRASEQVSIHANSQRGGIPNVLEQAVSKNLVEYKSI